MSVGNRIKTLRNGAKRTLKEQSEILGVSLNSVYRWEHDMVTPRKAALDKIADLYDVTAEWILRGDTVEPNYSYFGSMSIDRNPETRLIRMYRTLSSRSKYRILGYVERLCVEDMDDKTYPDF